MIFYKTVSSGNDFLHIETNQKTTKNQKSLLAQQMCERQTGAGADGIVFYSFPGETTPITVQFEIFNRDGSEAELSGNGMAGLTALLFYLDKCKSRENGFAELLTKSGRKLHKYISHNENRFRLSIEIGQPDFEALHFFPFLEKQQSMYEFSGINFYPVSVGNPHAVVLVDQDPGDAELELMGRELESADIFPARTNVEFVIKTGGNHPEYEKGTGFRVFYYERGVGPTLASSTGSAAVYAVLRKLNRLQGGLTIFYRVPGEPVRLTGNPGIYIENTTEIIYKGEFFSEKIPI